MGLSILRSMFETCQRAWLAGRPFFWTAVIALLTLHLSQLMARSDEAPIIWTAPTEPPGAVILTAKGSALKVKPSPDQAAVLTAEPVSTQAGMPADLPQTVAQTAAQTSQLHGTLRAALEQWSQAWSSQNVQNYLAMYAKDFSPPRGTRQAWAQARTRRIMGKQKIRHNMRDVTWRVEQTTAIVQFTQVYEDERMTLVDKKTLHWALQDGRWQIVREISN